MQKKILILTLLVLLILTGCTKIDTNYDNIVDEILGSNKGVNTVSSKYKLYIPSGVIQTKDKEYNQIFKIKHENVYLYVDTISYYYKNKLNYPMDNTYNYYYRKINNNEKNGYIGINKLDNQFYFIEIVYNYSKAEFYSDIYDLPVILTNILIIQDSIQYNEELLKNEFNNNNKDGKEIKYELDRPKDSKSTFSKYLQEYVALDENEVKLPDGD